MREPGTALTPSISLASSSASVSPTPRWAAQGTRRRPAPSALPRTRPDPDTLLVPANRLTVPETGPTFVQRLRVYGWKEDARHMADEIQRAVELFEGAIAVVPGGVTVRDPAKLRSSSTDRLVWQSVFGTSEEREAARWLLWELGQATGARPASINVRMMTYDTARAVFRAARAGRAGAILLEIARSEIAYTDQRPGEYVSVLIGAALREGYVLPLLIQGDHCQVNQKKYQADPEGEIGEVKKLIAEEIGAGFYNIDVDTSTLVDLSQATLEAQQRLNYERAAEITTFIRAHEPEGVTVSVGAEIGEVGMKNSTVEELHAFMRGYRQSLAALGTTDGISKISVQTGTSHGGVVLPDGSIADVKIDLQALAARYRSAREEDGLAGAVQHGASTL